MITHTNLHNQTLDTTTLHQILPQTTFDIDTTIKIIQPIYKQIQHNNTTTLHNLNKQLNKIQPTNLRIPTATFKITLPTKTNQQFKHNINLNLTNHATQLTNTNPQPARTRHTNLHHLPKQNVPHRQTKHHTHPNIPPNQKTNHQQKPQLHPPQKNTQPLHPNHIQPKPTDPITTIILPIHQTKHQNQPTVHHLPKHKPILPNIQ